MGFYKVMGFPCERNWWTPKAMGYYKLWVPTEMGKSRINCICVCYSSLEFFLKKKSSVERNKT